MKGMLVNNRLEFYDYISYDVLGGEKAKERVTLRVGDVIDMEEEEEEEAFAIIRAILCHMANNTNRYVFLVIDWFQVIRMNCWNVHIISCMTQRECNGDVFTQYHLWTMLPAHTSSIIALGTVQMCMIETINFIFETTFFITQYRSFNFNKHIYKQYILSY